MKNRKTVIIAFLLVAALVLGIGYAAYSTKLFINGTAEVASEAIAFTNAVTITNAESSDPTYGTASEGDGQYATFEVFGMTQKDQRVTFTYTITNNSDVAVKVNCTTLPTTTAANSIFSVVQGMHSEVTIPASGGTADVTVTVVLTQDVAAAVDPVAYTMEYTVVGVA